MVVVQPDKYTNWNLLDEDNPFAAFHRKFWGKDMSFDGQSERGADKYVVEEMNEAQLVEGCHVIHVDIDALCTKLWVRAEYLRVYEYLQAVYNGRKKHESGLTVVLTGQPGIELHHMNPPLNRGYVDEIFYRYGPTPRLCIKFIINPESLEDYDLTLEESFDTIKMDSPAGLIDGARVLRMDSLSHKICLVHRVDWNNVRELTM
ncbi:hypothetical protein SERLA73DRAFT_70446 [Serpula lacrymans var. lacrymans S7.3]|uniref:Uncharacterized protein n=2 Tax=Serpula lacrymans var. lacrymans TaxID=341189 RepID=F8PMY8_SERL3|nr:uncharacterized protein SERLADRAFT_434567 [Serpula lacrymans var. lacrymans S7.9]EGO02970.1 hypothetical protein SERLA73DRAFT_70446 [Serpula lacrymans var. lacrymans S7.3]EGO28653.1 hypothetical protein SERLADRAFT_434567 [Serpula lacrymans var. lacrymans S7.9]